MLLDLSHPVLNGGEGFTVGDVVGDDDTVGALVVAGSDGLEAFLPGSIPNLELHDLVIDLLVPDLKVDTDSGHKVVSEHVILSTQLVKGWLTANLTRRDDLPTPELPMRSTLKR